MSTTLSKDELIALSKTVSEQVMSIFDFTTVQNEYADEISGPNPDAPVAMALNLLEGGDPKPVIAFQDPTVPPNTPTIIGFVLRRGELTFIYYNDGVQDSYLLIMQGMKAIQTLALEQQILSAPEVSALVDELLAQ